MLYPRFRMGRPSKALSLRFLHLLLRSRSLLKDCTNFTSLLHLSAFPALPISPFLHQVLHAHHSPLQSLQMAHRNRSPINKLALGLALASISCLLCSQAPIFLRLDLSNLPDLPPPTLDMAQPKTIHLCHLRRVTMT